MHNYAMYVVEYPLIIDLKNKNYYYCGCGLTTHLFVIDKGICVYCLYVNLPMVHDTGLWDITKITYIIFPVSWLKCIIVFTLYFYSQ